VRAQWRGDVAEKVAAARAAAVVADGIGGIGAQPLAASFAERIDALHGEAGQVLHLFSLSGRCAPIDFGGMNGSHPKSIRPLAAHLLAAPRAKQIRGLKRRGYTTEWGRAGTTFMMAGILPRAACAVK
jgi:hypothetical protein